MREIKFRAWHSNKMVYWGLFRNDDTYLLDVEVTIDEDEDPVMQYTGLKDKNGKEIYEGDIVKHQLNNAGGEENKTYSSEEVVFDNGAFRNKRGFLIADYGYHQVGNQLYQAEVIGNIYENPELLES